MTLQQSQQREGRVGCKRAGRTGILKRGYGKFQVCAKECRKESNQQLSRCDDDVEGKKAR
jgi:hypothetical protein